MGVPRSRVTFGPCQVLPWAWHGSKVRLMRQSTPLEGTAKGKATKV